MSITINHQTNDISVSDGSFSVGGGQLSNRNLIINGAMQVSQRGDYSTAETSFSTGYYLDRWNSQAATVTADLQHTSASPDGYGKSLKIASTSSATGSINSSQKLEGTTVEFMKGKTVTLSAWVRSNTSSARLLVYSGAAWVTIPDAAHTGGGDWERLTTTFTVPTTSVEEFRPYISIRDADASTTSITSGDYVEFTQVQLEIGDTATPFEHRSYGDELARCQRYYFYEFESIYGGRYSTSSGFAGFASLPVTMRADPTLSYETVRTTTGLSAYASPNSAQYLMTHTSPYVQGLSADAEL